MIAANEAFLLDLRGRLQRYVRKRSGEPYLAEDVAQDVLLKLYVRRDSLPEERHRVVAWALRAARNALVDRFRSPAGKVRSTQIDGAVAAVNDPDDAGVHAQLARCVAPMVQRLAAPYRQAVELTDLQQQPQHEVARRLGISLSGAKSRVQRGRRKLRAMLAECCRIEFDRRGAVQSFAPTARAQQFCASGNAEKTCVH
jgi:RNA polymerase sigma-70 factor (ECF subfamily)